MSSGRTHAIVSVVVSGVLAGVSVSFDAPLGQSIALVLGCFSGVLVHPDYDLTINRSYTIIRRDLGALWYVWWLVWYPYARLIPHRHFVSHAPVVSTAIRVMYIGWLPYVALRSFDIDIASSLFVWWFVGLCVSDTLHWVFDRF